MKRLTKDSLWEMSEFRCTTNPYKSLEVRVHTDGDDSSPEIYPLPHPKGIVKTGGKDDPDFDKIAAQLVKASRR